MLAVGGGSKQIKRTEDGLESQIATAQFGPFLLTKMIAPKLLAAHSATYTPRVVLVSSAAHAFGPGVDFDVLAKPDADKYSNLTGYGAAKSANVLSATEPRGLQEDQHGYLHPGSVLFPLRVIGFLAFINFYRGLREAGDQPLNDPHSFGEFLLLTVIVPAIILTLWNGCLLMVGRPDRVIDSEYTAGIRKAILTCGRSRATGQSTDSMPPDVSGQNVLGSTSSQAQAGDPCLRDSSPVDVRPMSSHSCPPSSPVKTVFSGACRPDHTRKLREKGVCFAAGLEGIARTTGGSACADTAGPDFLLPRTDLCQMSDLSGCLPCITGVRDAPDSRPCLTAGLLQLRRVDTGLLGNLLP
ncbi:hypothetical protein DFH06DRAFT_1410034 [Mycena polygramma]|nr:hypothetical protein DFH06DRAFT_1410034 [Mycena polygramma]